MKLIPYSDACAAIAAACPAGPEESIPVHRSLGAVQAGPAIGAVASPAFNNAAMDGFAVRAAETDGATPGTPVDLPVVGECRVGALAEAAAPGAGCALRVATGALTPPSFDAVVPLEQAIVVDRGQTVLLRLTQPVLSGRNLRFKGEEYAAGAAFDFAGRRLHAGHIALLSAAGVSELSVRKPPPLALLTTGDEVRPPGGPLAPGEIANANAAWLAAWCAERRLEVAFSSHVADDARELADRFQSACDAGARVLISSGSASVGERDVLRSALELLGARVVFHGVAIRPGKPALFAMLENGEPVFGLPGNPLATAACMRFLAWLGIRRMMGMEQQAFSPLRLDEAVKRRDGFTHFVLARRAGDRARLVHPQRPAQAGALARADCWLRLEGGRTEAVATVPSFAL